MLGADEDAVRVERLEAGLTPGLQADRHLRGGVRVVHAVHVRHVREGVRGGADAAPEGRHPRQRSEPHRPGDRVRLLLLPRRLRAARGGLRDGDGQLQPGDGVDRLRHGRPPLLRAADVRRRVVDHRARARSGRRRRLRRAVRRTDAAQARAARCRRPGSESSVPRRTRSTSPRIANGSRSCCGISASRRRRAEPRPRRKRRAKSPPRSASRSSFVRRTSSAGARWRSSTTWRALDRYMAERRRRVTGTPGPDRQVPRRRRGARRGRRRRCDRRRRHRRDHGAHRGGRHPLRRQLLRRSAVQGHRPPRRGDSRLHAAHRPCAESRRPHERAIRDQGRHGLRARGQSAGIADRAVSLEGDRRSARQGRGAGDGRPVRWRSWA